MKNKQEVDYLTQAYLKNDMPSRLCYLLIAKVDSKNRFAELEKITGVSRENWRSWWNKLSSPSGTLVEAGAKAWPQHAFWLITGIEDSKYGHTAPIVSGWIPPGNSPVYAEQSLWTEKMFRAQLEKIDQKTLKKLEELRASEIATLKSQTT